MSLATYYTIGKVAFVGLFLLALVTAGFKGYAWVNMKLEHQAEQSRIELENARKFKVYDAAGAANLARANTEIVSLSTELARLQGIANGKDQALQAALAEIKKNNEKIFNLGETVASLESNIRKLRTESDHVYKAGTGDINEQYFIDIMYPVKDKDGKVEKEVPYAWAIFYPNKPAEQKWKYGIYALDYHIRTIQSEQTDGQINTYTEVWFENNARTQSKGYEVPVSITSSEFKQAKLTEKQFYLWSPHLNLNVDAGYGFGDGGTIVAGGLSFSAMGYGRTKNDLIWRFIDFGISTNGSTTYAKLTPFTYNIGENIPLVSNTFIGPFVGYGLGGDAQGDIVLGLGLSIPF